MKRIIVLLTILTLGWQLRAQSDVQVVYGCALGEFGKKEMKLVMDQHNLVIWKEDDTYLYSSGSLDYMGVTWQGLDACFADGILMSLYFSFDYLENDSLYYIVEQQLNDRYKYYTDISKDIHVKRLLGDDYDRPGSHVWAKETAGQEVILHYFNHKMVLVFNNMYVAAKSEAKRHPSFCDVVLGQDLVDFCYELNRKGFRLIKRDLNHGQALMSGYYKGVPVSLLVIAKNGYVTNLWVNYEPKNPSWKGLKSVYDAIKGDLQNRLGEPQTCVEEFYDGYSPKYGLEALLYGGCKFVTEYRNDYYVYNLTIDTLGGYLTAFWITDLMAYRYFE